MTTQDENLEGNFKCPKQANNAACDFGGAPFLQIQTNNGIMPRVTIWRCKTCHHGVTWPKMNDVSRLYADRDSEDFLNRDDGWVQFIKKIWFRNLAKSLLAKSITPPRLIVDYGTGNGMLARCLSEVSRNDCEIVAIDFFSDAPNSMGAAKYMSFEDADSLRGKVDLLACFHVLEHDDNPHEFLEHLASYLAPHGTLAIEVPNIDCVWTPWFGKYCANWYAPYHRVHFSRTSLRNLLESHEFQVIEEIDICGPTISFSLANLMMIRPNSLLFLVGVLFRPIQFLAERLSKRPSALRVIARRSSVQQFRT